MYYRVSIIALLVAMLFVFEPAVHSAVAQQTIPGKIIPDIDPETESEQEDADLAEQEAQDQEAQEQEAQEQEGSDADPASTESDADSEDGTDENEDGPEPNLDFLDEGGLPESISQLLAMEKQVAEVTERVRKATVNIQVGAAQGSGVVVSRDGYILTAAHVISEPHQTATITFEDGSAVEAHTLGVHHNGIDSGMLKIMEKGRWPYVDMGESDTLSEGQWVVAIGHPGGIDAARGLVLRVGRLIAKSDEVLQTDCTLVGGDSGGPLLDMEGNLIGIHSRIGMNLTDNYHVPVDVFSDEWDDLALGKTHGRVRSWIGLGLEEDTNEVGSVYKYGPAAEAGLKPGDVIIRANGEDVEDKSDLRTAMRPVKPEETLTITVKRDDEELEFDVVVAYR